MCGPALLVSLATAIAGAACAGGADTCVGVGREWARLNAWAAAGRRYDPLIVSAVISLSNLFILLVCCAFHLNGSYSVTRFPFSR